MEWILWIVVAVMLALLSYTVFWTSIALNKKAQPAVDSFFDTLHAIVRYRGNRQATNNQGPAKSQTKVSD